MIMLVSAKIGSKSTEIFEAFREGDSHAFKHYFDLYFGPLMTAMRAFASDPEEAEMVVSDTFITLFEKRAEIKKPEHISGFLFVLARNKAIDRLRRQRRKTIKFEEVPFSLADVESKDWERLHIELMARVNEIIPRLKKGERMVVELSFFEGLTIRDIAAKLQLQEQSVRNLRSRALKYFRKKMRAVFE
jgi:RNA polymerase sigma factor (sigma-70 family)